VRDLLLLVVVGRLELHAARLRHTRSGGCRHTDLRFFCTFGTARARRCPSFSSLLRTQRGPRGLRSRPVAGACGAPVLRDQGPIGRPGTARPIQALTTFMPCSFGYHSAGGRCSRLGGEGRAGPPVGASTPTSPPAMVARIVVNESGTGIPL
jgi:hypothetical protein